MSSAGLGEEQAAACRTIRRRGKNKVAAQACRRRKVDHIALLEEEVAGVRGVREGLEGERRQLEERRSNWRERLGQLEARVLVAAGGLGWKLELGVEGVALVREVVEEGMVFVKEVREMKMS